jgi:glycosyltransferase involved in cell wall biosynthesis
VNICLNAQLISGQAGYRGAGVNNYARQLLAALGDLAQQGQAPHHFTAFVHTESLHTAGVTLAHTRLPLERPAARIAWEQTLLPLELARRHANLIHGLVNVLPLATHVPGVVTVHDLSFVRTPETLPPLKRAYLTHLCAASVRRAAAVIGVSRQTADDVIRCFGAPASKVHVVYNGVAQEFTPGDAAAVARFRQAKGLPPRYLLYLGTLEPRKNLELLVRAFARWRATDTATDAAADASGIKLVLAGGKGWYYDTIFAEVQNLGLTDAILFPGFIPPAELPDWYRGAMAFVYPSMFEGFGLPVLEAMACGTPVICSRAPSLLEVTGDAAIRIPAADEETLAHAIRLLCDQPALIAELRRRGLAQAAKFSWRRSAEQTIQVYNHVYSQVTDARRSVPRRT